MLTDGSRCVWDGVSDMADEVAGRDSTLVGTLLLGVLIFGLGAAAGFVARLLWPHPR